MAIRGIYIGAVNKTINNYRYIDYNRGWNEHDAAGYEITNLNSDPQFQPVHWR